MVCAPGSSGNGASKRGRSEIDAIASNRSIFGSAVRERRTSSGTRFVDVGELLSRIGPAVERVVQGVGEVSLFLPMLARARQATRRLFAVGQANQSAHRTLEPQARHELGHAAA